MTATAITEPIAIVPPPGTPPAPPRRSRFTLLTAVALAVVVTVGLGAYGRLHEGTGTAINLAGFSSGLHVKSWLATLAIVFAVVQLITALRMYGKLGRAATGVWSGRIHRWSGRLAVLVTVPVAVHCLYALGFDDSATRVLVHSALGCFVYGVFAAKMVLVARDGAPRWALPVFGGLLFAVLTGVWVTSAVWFFGTSGISL